MLGSTASERRSFSLASRWWTVEALAPWFAAAAPPSSCCWWLALFSGKGPFAPRIIFFGAASFWSVMHITGTGGMVWDHLLAACDGVKPQNSKAKPALIPWATGKLHLKIVRYGSIPSTRSLNGIGAVRCDAVRREERYERVVGTFEAPPHSGNIKQTPRICCLLILSMKSQTTTVAT